MDDAEELRRLEESLWRTDTRFDAGHLEEILAPDFLESGRSGRVYSRSDILAMEAQEIRARLPLQGFRVSIIGDDVRLVTYVSEVEAGGEVQVANRSSLWQRTPAGWRLAFHQGTPAGGWAADRRR